MSTKLRPVIIISGPTATGKTDLAIRLALDIKKHFAKSAAVVNFDSLLFYKGLDIGTAKPLQEERFGIGHYLIDIRNPSEVLNAADYCPLAVETIKELHSNNIIPILVGGSGFYLRAFMKGMFEGGRVEGDESQKAKMILETEGPEELMRRLKEIDPESANRYHINDHYRIMRALEYFWANKKPISKARQILDENRPYDFSTHIHPDWSFFHAHIDIPKNKHLEIIKRRTLTMVQKGLIGETQKLLQSGLTGNERPLHSIGYKEAQMYIKGELKTTDDFIERVNISTRQLAKAQRTFFNKITSKQEYDSLTDAPLIFQDIFTFLINHL